MRIFIQIAVALAVCFSVSLASGQNKVVVVPLGGSSPVEPYAPLAEPSPSVDQYSVGTDSVTDKKTGLIWEKNDSAIMMPWEAAWGYCQGRTTAGWHTWRLPSIDELNSIIYFATDPPVINKLIFGGTDPASYWSATTSASDGARAWYVHFSQGWSGTALKSSSLLYVRCVRGQYALHNTFKKRGNGTVEDLATGLMWQVQDDNIQRHWESAKAYCQGLVLGGKNDWRLPNIKELQSIIEYRTFDPAVDLPSLLASKSSPYWSATPNYQVPLYTWIVNFDTGIVQSVEATNAPYAKAYVRCVR